ncbi:thermonuclease family protein [Ottowia sp.]|uniref:thermonuclease family protein n=1 Tax=Ottowia sp. TaxID=1898956 RepID=UPI003A84123B
MSQKFLSIFRSAQGFAALVLMVGLLASDIALTMPQTTADPVAGKAITARVSYVVDGDSLWVRAADTGARIKLRLAGVDAPEICQQDGERSRTALQALADGQPVRVRVQAHDRWGRAIARVQRVSDGRDLAEAMVSQGWAWSERRLSRRHPLAVAQAQARQVGRGLFARPAPEYPADFRRKHGPCGRNQR